MDNIKARMAMNITVGAVILIVLVTLTIKLTGDNRERENYRVFKKNIMAIKMGNEETFQDIADFEWDYVYIIAPYETNESVEKETGITFEKAKGSERRGCGNLLFIKEEEVVAYIEYMGRSEIEYLIKIASDDIYGKWCYDDKLFLEGTQDNKLLLKIKEE